MSDEELVIESNDEDELVIEENDEVNDGNDEATSSLLSPPRNWPDCFSTNALKQYVATSLKGRRVRLSDPPEAEHVRMGAGMQLTAGAGAPLANAIKLRDMYGWDVLGGYILYEEDTADEEPRYTSREHFWNANARGLWIDLTPRRASHSSLVLVESASVAAPVPSPEQQARIERSARPQLCPPGRPSARSQCSSALAFRPSLRQHSAALAWHAITTASTGGHASMYGSALATSTAALYASYAPATSPTPNFFAPASL